MSRRIGIFGGTFDPVHCGHMIVARLAMEQYGLDEIRLMTGGMPPHKKSSGITPARMRHEMVQAAVEGEQGFIADDFEVDKETYSYTAETLTQLNKIYPDDEIYFIIGEDSLNDILKWYRPDIIVQNCILLIFPRKGKESLEKLIAEKKAVLGGDMRSIDAPLIGVSSTAVRKRVAEGKPIRFFVPDSVVRYIEDNGLYGG